MKTRMYFWFNKIKIIKIDLTKVINAIPFADLFVQFLFLFIYKTKYLKFFFFEDIFSIS